MWASSDSETDVSSHSNVGSLSSKECFRRPRLSGGVKTGLCGAGWLVGPTIWLCTSGQGSTSTLMSTVTLPRLDADVLAVPVQCTSLRECSNNRAKDDTSFVSVGVTPQDWTASTHPSALSLFFSRAVGTSA
jgi:hypothetical protein